MDDNARSNAVDLYIHSIPPIPPLNIIEITDTNMKDGWLDFTIMQSHRRKLQSYGKNLNVITLDNKKYLLCTIAWQWDWYAKNAQLIELTDELKSLLDAVYDWPTMWAFVHKIVNENQKYNGSDEWVPAGPDSTKFQTCRGGKISVSYPQMKVGEDRYSVGRYCDTELSIGGNFDRSKKTEILSLVWIVLKKVAACLKYSNSPKKNICVWSKSTMWGSTKYIRIG